MSSCWLCCESGAASPSGVVLEIEGSLSGQRDQVTGHVAPAPDPGKEPEEPREPAAAGGVERDTTAEPASAAEDASRSKGKGVNFGTAVTHEFGGQATQEGPAADAAEDAAGNPEAGRGVLKTRRSITSRGFGAQSTLDSEALQHIDPWKGLRRLESVATVAGDVTDKYQSVRKLGEGSFGLVMQVVSRETKGQFAMKIIPVRNLKDSKRFETELNIARRLNHPHIIRLHETFREGEAYHLVMELSSGGDLFEKIVASDSSSGGFPMLGLKAPQVARYAWQMLAGIAYLHHYQFCHRDIKPENYLLDSKSDGAPLKLIDFGLARSCPDSEKMKSKVGTAHYVAPEVIAEGGKGYKMKCDVWSVGVTVWFISVGGLPFDGKDQTSILRSVVKGKYEFRPHIWDRHKHPEQLKDFIRTLMNKDVEARPTAKAVLDGNEWLARYGDPLRAQAEAPERQAAKKGCCTIS